MPRIKIKDLPRDKKISKEEMKRVMGGYSVNLVSPRTNLFLSLKPERSMGAYNAPYFSLRKAELD